MQLFSIGLCSTLLVAASLTPLSPGMGAPLGATGDARAAVPHVVRGELSPDGKWAVYSVANEAGEQTLFSLPFAGGGEPTRLGGPLSSPLGEQWAISPDGQRVVYLAGALLSVPIDGRAAPVRLDGTSTDDLVQDFVLGEGGHVVFRAGRADQYTGLFSAAIDGGGEPTLLVAPNERGEVLRRYALAPDGAFVVFLSHHDDGRIARLYSVPTEGGTPACLAPHDFAVQDFRIAADGARVVCRGTAGKRNDIELLSAPIDGSQLPRSLSGAPQRGRTPQSYELSADGAHVVYLAQQGNGLNALFGVRTDGSAAPLELAREVCGNFRIDPTGRSVLYSADRGEDDGLALFSVALDGSAAPLELSAPLTAGAHVGWFDATADGTRVVYALQRAHDGGTELWAVSPAQEPVRVHLATVDEARECRLSADGRRVVYLGARATLYTLALDGASAPVALESGVASEFRLAPDGARALCSRTGAGAGPVLLSVALDGSSSAQQFSAGGTGNSPAQSPVVLPPQIGIGGSTGFRDFSYGLTGSSTPTGEKPECKLWWNDGSWWGDLYNDTAQEYHIYRLVQSSQTWVDTGTVLDDRNSTKGDVLWDQTSQKLYFASHVFTTNATSTPSNFGRLYRFSYTHGTGYVLDAGFPVDITRGNAEALTIAKDTLGRIWATWVESARVMINHSAGSDLVWGLPFVLPVVETSNTLTTDDISACISFGTNVGVMWSNQLTGTTYFGVHHDADADTTWQEEVVVPDIHCSGACADDLFSLKTDTKGNVGAVLKTSLTGPDDPLILLAVRSPTSGWRTATFGRVQDHHTRPILLFDDVHDRAFVFATHPENSGAIYTKSTTAADLHFDVGLGTPFIQNATDLALNNATSTKQNVDAETDIVVMASDQDTHFYVHNFLDLPPAVTSFAPTNGLEGTNVTITGGGFRRTTGVSFNGSPASFTVISNRQIRAIVPAGATTGKISVTTDFGTDSSEDVYSVSGTNSMALWPPNHALVDVDLSQLLQVSQSALAITSISQDEPLDEHGNGNKKDDCDADGIGTNTAILRAKRNDHGNGRVYRISFEITRQDHSTSAGFLMITVPVNEHGGPPKDDGQTYDSTANCTP